MPTGDKRENGRLREARPEFLEARAHSLIPISHERIPRGDMHRPWEESHETWSSHVPASSLLFLGLSFFALVARYSFVTPPRRPPTPEGGTPWGNFIAILMRSILTQAR